MTKKNKYILEARNIHKRFTYPIDNYLLKNIDLSVAPGESTAIIGRSGQGKSTLLHILGTLEAATEGELFVGGESVNIYNKSRIRNQHLAFIFQSFHLMDDFSVIDNVLMPAKIARRDTQKGSEAYQKALEHLEAVELTDGPGPMESMARCSKGSTASRRCKARFRCDLPRPAKTDEEPW